MLLLPAAPVLTSVFDGATVEYFSSEDPALPPLQISRCLEIDDSFLFVEAARDFPDCVRSRAALISPASNHTLSVIDQGVQALASGAVGYNTTFGQADKVCKHHVQMCRMLHWAESSQAQNPQGRTNESTVVYTVDVQCGALFVGSERCSFPFHMSMCHHVDTTTEAMQECRLHRAVLTEGVLGDGRPLTEWVAFDAVDVVRYNPNYKTAMQVVCEQHTLVCASIPEYQELSDGCRTTAGSCRSALRHLHAMMFRDDLAQQQCNNFALKSIRGQFHDSLSSDTEGSILWEMHDPMNLGLCRWTQYINALADATRCDPGTIVAMAGELGFEACGGNLWVKPRLGSTIARAPGLNEWADSSHRRARTDDG